MTRECDAFRHHASEQPSGLTWNQVHAEEAYERTGHNFGRHLSAGLSLDLGGAVINIGTGGRYGEYGSRPYSYGGNYGSGAEYGYPQSNLYYPSRSSYSYNDSGYGYNGYANNYNSADSQRYYYGQASYQPYASGSYEYNQAYPSQQYAPQNLAYGNQYDSSYQYDDQYSSNQRYSNSDYSSRYPSSRNFDANGSEDSNYGNPFDLSSRRNGSNGNGRFDTRYSSSDEDGGYEYNVRPQNSNYYSQDRYNYSDYGYQNQNNYGYQNDYSQGNYCNGNDWQRMRVTLQSMLGSSPSQYNRNVPDDLGCATVVSAALRRCYGLRINDTNVDGLEGSLRRNGFEAVPIQDAQPGDTIIAHRRNGRHGHTAIYVGDGKIVNNSSSKGKVVVGSINSFSSRDYESVVAYRRV